MLYLKERKKLAAMYRLRAKTAKDDKMRKFFNKLAKNAFSTRCNCGENHEHKGDGFCGY